MPKKLSKPLASPSSTSTFPALAPLPPSTLTDQQPIPRRIVFDLDYTLWPFWVDTHVSAPLKATTGHASATDRFNESFAFYNDVPTLLLHLRDAGIKLGAASRTAAPDIARDLLKLLHLAPLEEGAKPRKAADVFDHVEIYPGSKIAHFERIRKASGVDYVDMLFFDDESRNRNVESLGVTMYLVKEGVTRAEIDNGVWEWRKRRGIPYRVPDEREVEE